RNEARLRAERIENPLHLEKNEPLRVGGLSLFKVVQCALSTRLGAVACVSGGVAIQGLLYSPTQRNDDAEILLQAWQSAKHGLLAGCA
ncbi:MAG: hypothetical protein ACXWNU_09110, partial [Candidatus Binataceae bacterium]